MRQTNDPFHVWGSERFSFKVTWIVCQTCYTWKVQNWEENDEFRSIWYRNPFKCWENKCGISCRKRVKWFKKRKIMLLHLKSKYSWKECKDLFVPWSLSCFNEAHLGQWFCYQLPCLILTFCWMHLKRNLLFV